MEAVTVALIANFATLIIALVNAKYQNHLQSQKEKTDSLTEARRRVYGSLCEKFTASNFRAMRTILEISDAEDIDDGDLTAWFKRDDVTLQELEAGVNLAMLYAGSELQNVLSQIAFDLHQLTLGSGIVNKNVEVGAHPNFLIESSTGKSWILAIVLMRKEIGIHE